MDLKITKKDKIPIKFGVLSFFVAKELNLEQKSLEFFHKNISGMLCKYVDKVTKI